MDTVLIHKLKQKNSTRKKDRRFTFKRESLEIKKKQTGIQKCKPFQKIHRFNFNNILFHGVFKYLVFNYFIYFFSRFLEDFVELIIAKFKNKIN